MVALNAGRVGSTIAGMLMQWGWDRAVGDVKARIRLLSDFVRDVVANGTVFRMPPDQGFTSDDQIHTANLMASFGACRLPFDNCVVIAPLDNHPVSGHTEEIYFYKFTGQKDVRWTPDQWQAYAAKLNPHIVDKLANLHGDFFELEESLIPECPVAYQVVGIQYNALLGNHYFTAGDSLAECIPFMVVAPVAPNLVPCIWLNRGYETNAEHLKEGLMALNRVERHTMLSASNNLVRLITFLATRGIQTEKIDPPERLSRATEKRRGVPLFSYHQIFVPKQNNKSRGTGLGTHASPRLHMRRGHIRNLPSGHMTWVRPCLVGYEDLGVVVTDYKVKAQRCNS